MRGFVLSNWAFPMLLGAFPKNANSVPRGVRMERCLVDYISLSLPRKQNATVPGPAWVPMTGPTL